MNKYLIDLAIITFLQDGPRRYVEIREFTNKFLTQTISKSVFDDHVKRLLEKDIIQKPGPRKYDPYRLTDESKRKHDQNLLYDPNGIRQKIYRLIFLMQEKNRTFGIQGFTTSEVFGDLMDADFKITASDIPNPNKIWTHGYLPDKLDYSDYELARIFLLLQDKELIAPTGKSRGGLSVFAISNNTLALLTQEVWATFQSQLISLSIVCAHKRKPIKGERERLVEFYGLQRAQYLMDDWALDRQRFRKESKGYQQSKLIALSREQKNLSARIEYHMKRILDYSTKLKQTHDFPPEIVTGVLFPVEKSK